MVFEYFFQIMTFEKTIKRVENTKISKPSCFKTSYLMKIQKQQNSHDVRVRISFKKMH
jgi:hypothetical protein